MVQGCCCTLEVFNLNRDVSWLGLLIACLSSCMVNLFWKISPDVSLSQVHFLISFPRSLSFVLSPGKKLEVYYQLKRSVISLLFTVIGLSAMVVCLLFRMLICLWGFPLSVLWCIMMRKELCASCLPFLCLSVVLLFLYAILCPF